VEVIVAVAVIVGLAAAAAGWVFLRTRRRLAPVGADGWQEATIVVRGRYQPDTITVRRGLPLRLIFLRDEDVACSRRVIFPDFGVSRTLPAHRPTQLDLMPDRDGDFLFTCELGMYQGTLFVRR